ncbi:hypothetical protein Avbf_03116 [Armadillidium vulgare]|nr:hypothetical protein Avbf_03116 [Armadillidium vulgare]
MRCGYACNIKPCTEPCPKKLKCGHECIGYCGEKCPKLCRICDNTKVNEILCDLEKTKNARFVQLEDCDDIFESSFLDEYMSSSKSYDNYKIAMKLCPKCKVPIYNTKRYQNIIVPAYQRVVEAIRTYIAKQPMNVMSGLRHVVFNRFNPVPHQEYQLNDFQEKMKERSENMIKNGLSFDTEGKIRNLIKKLDKYTNHISRQAMYEFSCELRRLEICSCVEKCRQKDKFFLKPLNDTEEISLHNMLKFIDFVIKLNVKFDEETEELLAFHLKELKQYIQYPDEVLNTERLVINKSLSLQQGIILPTKID